MNWSNHHGQFNIEFVARQSLLLGAMNAADLERNGYLFIRRAELMDIYNMMLMGGEMG